MKTSSLLLATALAIHVPYSDSQANISVMLAAEAHCGHDNIMENTWIGTATGFVPTMPIYSGIFLDAEGYIGYLPSDQSIYVSFRGSVSVQNWITDFVATYTRYDTYPECDCWVHDGFLWAQQSVYTEVLAEVQRLK